MLYGYKPHDPYQRERDEHEAAALEGKFRRVKAELGPLLIKRAQRHLGAADQQRYARLLNELRRLNLRHRELEARKKERLKYEPWTDERLPDPRTLTLAEYEAAMGPRRATFRRDDITYTSMNEWWWRSANQDWSPH